MPESPPEIRQSSHDAPAQPEPSGFWPRLDAWMAQSPWHPRLLPFALYLTLLLVIDLGREHVALWTYPLLYTFQCVVVGYLLWRYRRLLPELTVRFHWLAVPIGLGLTAAWVGLGWMTIAIFPSLGPQPTDEPHFFQLMFEQSAALFWLSMGLRFVGMVMIVPLFEELWVRSLCLRAFHSPRLTGLGLIQFMEDLPVVGDWVVGTKLSKRAAEYPPLFTHQFNLLPVGALTTFGVLVSTAVFTLAHMPRDWMGCIACGLAWCWLLWYTNTGGRRMGLGPIVWSHGITNAALWGWVLWSDQWLFM